MIVESNVFAESVKNDWRAYDNIQKIATSEWDDYTTGFLLDYVYFKNYYEMISTDLGKQQELDTDGKTV